MERSKIVLFVLSSFMAGMSPVFAQSPAQYVELPLKYIHIPKGFDSNDYAQVIVRGSLPNLCYQGLKVSARRYLDRIFIRATVDRPRTDMICAQVEVPFVEAVSLGTLEAGGYGVVLNPGTKSQLESQIQIEKAKPSVSRDNHVYARVEMIEKDLAKGEIVLKGSNPSECFEFDRVEFVGNSVAPTALKEKEASAESSESVAQSGLGSLKVTDLLTDTYSVLPILKQLSDFCPRKMVPFEIRAKVPSEYRRHPLMKNRSVLLHVRVMDGRSLNTIFGEEEF